MRYVSTRGEAPAVGFSEAVVGGLAPDGGLYVPERFPDPVAADGSEAGAVARAVLAPFLEGDPLEGALDDLLAETFTFPIPVEPLFPGDPAPEGGPGGAAGAAEGHRVLELFHGPTGAFKDVGAAFMAACLERIPGPPRTVLVATSGDTGSAVAAAFHGRANVRVAVLFPDDGVSARQRKLLTCFGGNVRSFTVGGTFDDAQRVVKAALADPALVERHGLTTANSINVARLLPQVAYHALGAALAPDRVSVVPTGNAGNALAALYAKELGFPIESVAMATNRNRTIPDFLAGDAWSPRPSVSTPANAMDVGDPSNMERVRHLFGSDEATRSALRSVSVSDDAIRLAIRAAAARGRVVDPHTAVGLVAAEHLGLEGALVSATAHPAKFDEVVEPLIGRRVEVPAPLAELLERPTRATPLEATVEALERALTPRGQAPR